MFKKLLLASAILAVSSTAALASAPYVGIGSGLTVNTGSSSAVDTYYRGIPVNLFAGYGGIVSDSFYLAGELNATAGTFDVSGYNTIKTSYGLGLSILPGMMLSDHTMAFVRAGIVGSHFTNANENRFGGEAGFGLQTSLTQSLDLRGEYDWIAYKSTTANNFTGTPRSDQFNLALVYNFN